MDPNGDDDPGAARGIMNRIATRPIGSAAAIVVVVLLLVWFLTTR